MAQPSISKAAIENAVELPVYLETFEAKRANDFSNSVIPMISSRDVRTRQPAVRSEVPEIRKSQKNNGPAATDFKGYHFTPNSTVNFTPC